MPLSHLFMLAFALLFPAWDIWELRRMRRTPDGNARSGFYLRTTIALWILVVLIAQFYPLPVYLKAPPGALFSLGGTANLVIGVLVFTAFVALIAAPFVMIAVRPSVKAQIVMALEPLAFLLPRDAHEDMLFALVSLSAGICEELVCRGYFIRYFQEGPWGLSLTAALFVAALLFGLAHAGHGIRGIVSTGLLGLTLGVLYISTGSLVAPIVLHALFDLRVLAFARFRRTSLAAQSAAPG